MSYLTRAGVEENPDTPIDKTDELGEILEKILRPITQLRGSSTEDSTRLKKEDIETAKSQLEAFLNNAETNARIDELTNMPRPFDDGLHFNYWFDDRLTQLKQNIKEAK